MLIHAAARGDIKEVNKLLAAGANVNEAAPLSGLTALMMAARECNPEMIMHLLLAGADVNQRSVHGRTALHELFAYHHEFTSEQRVRALKALLNAPGIDLNAASNVGNTPLDSLISAHRVHDLDALRVLLDAGIDVNKPYVDGSFPLENVLNEIENNDVDDNYLNQVALLLLEYGAKVRDWSTLRILGAEPNNIMSSIKNAAAKRRFPALAAWSRVREELLREELGGGEAAAAGNAPNNHNNLPPLERVNAEEAAAAPRNGANRGGARRRRSMKKRKASTTRRRHRA